MTNINKASTSLLSISFHLLVVLSLVSCAGSNIGSTQNPKIDKKAITLIFPDLPIPNDLKIVEDESVIISSPGYRGGLITLRGRLSPIAIQNYFLDALPQKGWQFISSLNARKGLMAFNKHGTGQCLITYFRSGFGYSKVEIWMAEPIPGTGGVNGSVNEF